MNEQELDILITERAQKLWNDSGGQGNLYRIRATYKIKQMEDLAIEELKKEGVNVLP